MPTTAPTTCVSTRTCGVCAPWAIIRGRGFTNCHETVSWSGRRTIGHHGDDRRRDRANPGHGGRRPVQSCRCRRGPRQTGAGDHGECLRRVRAGRTGPGVGALRSRMFRDERRSRGQARDSGGDVAGLPAGSDERCGDRAGRGDPHRGGDYHHCRRGGGRLRAGATRTGQGIITIAGTGSIAFGRNPAGRSARAGGWGHIFGDEGGGFDIARQAARAALRLEEGWGPATVLRDSLLAATGSESANEMLHRFYTDEWPRSRVATLSRLVDAAAGESDGVALGILQGPARQLAMLAGAVREELWPPGKVVEVAYIGGVFQSRILLENFRTLVELPEGVRCAAPRRGPAEGALREAYRSAGLEWGPEDGG